MSSLHTASRLTGSNLQSISFSCTGKYTSTSGLYFRHLDPTIDVITTDIGDLTLESYDDLCGVKRQYHSIRDMAKKRSAAEIKRKLKQLTENIPDEHKEY